MMSRKMQFFGILVVFVVTTLASLFILNDKSSDQNLEESQKGSASDGQTSASQVNSSSSTFDATSQSPSEIQIASHSDLWFSNKETIQSLSTKAIPIVKTGNCGDALAKAQDFRAFTNEIFQNTNPLNSTQGKLNGLESLTTQNHIKDSSLFFKSNQKFVQVRAEWLKNEPPSYRITALQFENSDLKGKPNELDISEVDSEAIYDVSSLHAIVSKLQNKQQDSVVGQSISRLQNGNLLSAEFIGGLPLEFISPTENCKLALNDLTAHCNCKLK